MDIREIRDRIDSIDNEMADLFEKRMQIVKEVAEFKRERGLPVEDHDREKRIIEKHSTRIEDNRIRSLYINFQQEVMQISKRWQHMLMNGMCVACAGDAESAGYIAARTIFPDSNIVVYGKCREAYKAVEDGACELAVLPLENSYSGEVGKVYDLIFSGDLYVNDIFAIAGEESTTRYAVISRVESNPDEGDGCDAFLMMFTVKDEIGGLAKAINIISAYGFNMRVLRSRPLKDLQWHYYFYAELEGNCTDGNGERLKRALSASCPVVRIAGTVSEKRDIVEK